MLAIGSVAPDIDAESSRGHFRLSERVGSLCAVVYFFPKAFTPGCTRETKSFRDNYAELRMAGASLVGVSGDDPRTQCQFAEAMQATFPIVSDLDGKVARAYDVRWPIIGVPQRVTYVLGPLRVVLAAFHHEIQIAKHQSDVLGFVDRLVTARR
jgi:peroxiredoxin